MDLANLALFSRLIVMFHNSPIISELVELVALRCQFRQVDVAPGHASSSDPGRSLRTDRNWILVFVQDVTCRVGKGFPNRQIISGPVVVRGVEDRNLRGSADVVEAGILGPLICQTTASQHSAFVRQVSTSVPLRTWLATSYYRSDIRIVCLSEFRQNGRRRDQRIDLKTMSE